MDNEFETLNPNKPNKKSVHVKQSMAPVLELIFFKEEKMWGQFDEELRQAKTLENTYYMDSSFLYSLTELNLWVGEKGAFLMPRRELRHRHFIFSLFWQPSAPKEEKNDYIVPIQLNGLLRWYLTRDNFIKYVNFLWIAF